jgi:hypothetical protein
LIMNFSRKSHRTISWCIVLCVMTKRNILMDVTWCCHCMTHWYVVTYLSGFSSVAPSQKTEANWSIYKAHLWVKDVYYWWCTFHDLQFETLLLLGRLAAGLFPCLRITRKSCLWFIHPSWCWWEWSLPHWTYPKDVGDLITVTPRWKPYWQPSIKQFWLVEALCHILFRRAASHAL